MGFVLAGLVFPGKSALGEGSSDETFSAAQIKWFETEIRPLLAARCFKCHGPNRQKGGLRLDSRTSLLAGGDSGPVVMPGEASESLLVEAVRYESLEMPPDGRLSDGEVAAIVKWIELGVPWPDESRLPLAAGAKFSEEDRDWWSFQPVTRPDVPEVDDGGWPRNPIDRFIVRKLAENSLAPSPEADRRTFIRRATFNLWGLPPSPEDVKRFVKDSSATAYEDLIGRLLESPRYGERWAQFWLDLVRYADSNGYKSDEYRPDAWRYRDYVIRALNDDMPYDRFVTEQLAGDELAPHDPDVVVATGYLRHWPYESNQRNVPKQWADILNDITDVTADVFLALGMSCARCHDHKYDPILQRDYYRLQAFFAPLLPRTDMTLAGDEARARLLEWEAQTADLREQIAAIERPHRLSAGRGAIDKFPPEIQAMIRKPVGKRTPFEHQIAEMAFRQVEPEAEKFAGRIEGKEKAQWEDLKRRLAEFDHLRPKNLPAAFTVTDVGPVAPPVQIPGRKDGGLIEPGLLTIMHPEPADIAPLPAAPSSTGRRTALAHWITRQDNPLASRVIVNRIWQRHFGRGLVSTASDFGRLGEPPSHPELLDWLAADFVAHGWSLKHLHRLIMNSATYRQASLAAAAGPAMQIDPENRLLSRMNIRRLDAEQIRDAALAVSGELDLSMDGPAVDSNATRRSIYLKVLRNQPDPLLDVFDAPDHFTSTALRNSTTTAPQALWMINGPWTAERAKAMAARLKSGGETGVAEILKTAFQLCYAREPSDEERERILALLGGADTLSNDAVLDLGHVLLNSNEFLYLD